jgi:Rhodopirellula transposase DDE domain
MDTKAKEDAVRKKYQRLCQAMDERARRLWAATEAESLGYGGVSIVSRATGLARNTISAGIDELDSLDDPAHFDPPRIRRPGGGRKPLTDTDPSLLADLQALIDPVTRGDPMSPLRWITKSTRQLARVLGDKGHKVSHETVASLLHDLDFSLQANRKTLEGTNHPDRDAQFEFINHSILDFRARQLPAASVDTKKKENVGNYKNSGRQWLPKGHPVKVRAKDFPDKDKGKVIPYGVYDLARNEGWVSVGVDHDTARFAVCAIGGWWERMGRAVYPRADRLLITADGGGSNSSRSRLWLVSLQGLADATGMRVSVCHFPPGTSKWDKIEHRMFCHITGNWRGQPLTSRELVLELIRGVRTATGLTIQAEMDERLYPTGIKVSDDLLAPVRIERNAFHPEWNYSISPNQWFVRVAS